MLRQVVLVFGLLTLAVSQSGAQGPAMGQLAGNLRAAKTYSQGTVITDFEQAGPLNQFTIQEGQLVVPSTGFYYIYGQAFFQSASDNRAGIAVNGDTISLLAPADDPESAAYGNRFTGVMKLLEEGDRISLMSVYTSTMWMQPQHTFFGAYKIA